MERHVDHSKSLSPTKDKFLPFSPPNRDTTVTEESESPEGMTEIVDQAISTSVSARVTEYNVIGESVNQNIQTEVTISTDTTAAKKKYPSRSQKHPN